MDGRPRRIAGRRIDALLWGKAPSVMPGVLQIEAMAQVSSIALLRQPENQGKIGYFMSADKVKFRKPVMPGDTLMIESELLKIRRNIGYAKCRCSVNGQTTSECELKFALMD